MNPCVSLAAYIVGIIPFVDLVVYTIAQFAGSTFGYYLLHVSISQFLRVLIVQNEALIYLFKIADGCLIWRQIGLAS